MPTYIDTTNLSPATIATLQGPVITQIQITDSSYVVLDDTAVSTSGGYITITGSNFTAGTQVVIGTVAASSVTFINSTTLNVQVPAQSAGTYVVYVTTNTGSVAIMVNGLTYSGTPTWVTGSTLTPGQIDTAISIQLSATGDAPITYSLAAGSSLPPGLSLSSAGLISGTVTGITSETVYNFTVNAADAEAQDSPRAFSITITAGDQYFEYVTTLLSASTPTSTFVTDASTNAFAVTINGDTRPSNFGPYTPGYYSNYFDGSGDYLSIDYASGSTIAGDFTWECWAYDTGATGYGTLLGWRNGSSGFSGFIVQRNNSTNNLSVTINQGGVTITQTSNTYVTNRWNHVALVRSGTTVTLYVNGTSAGTGTLSGSFNPGSSYWIGSDPFNNISATQLQGYVSNQRFVNGTAVYTSNFTPPTAPLTAIANTGLLTCQSNRFIDNSTNNFAITRSGDVRVDNFDPFLPDTNFAGRGSGYFDGTTDYLTTPSINLATSDFTLETWIYRTATKATESVFLYPANNGFNLNFETSGTVVSISRYGIAYIAQISYTVPLNQWFHIAVSKSSNVYRVFVNGTQIGSTYTDSTAIAAGAYNIGADSVNAGREITGYISNFRLIIGSALYTTNFTPSTTPLTAVTNTSLLTLQSNQPTNNSMFLDASTNNFNITRNGNTTQGSFSPYGGGWSNYMGGDGNHLDTPYNASFDFGTGDFSIECFAYVTDAGRTQDANKYGVFVSGGLFQSVTNFWNFTHLISGGVISFLSIGVGAADVLTVSGLSISLNAWHHFVACRTGTTLSIFVDGTRVATTTYSSAINTNSSGFVVIGRSVYGSPYQNWTQGYFSNVRIIKGTQPYNAGSTTITVPTSPLTPIANTSLLTCADNRFIDDSANNLTITRNGSVSVQRFNPFNPVTTTPTSYSAYFDGTGDYLSVPTNQSALAFGSSDFTIEAWVYKTTSGLAFVFCGQTDAQTVGGSAYGLYVTDTAATSDVYIGGTGYGVTSPNPTLNTWAHVALVRTGGTLSTYLNGTRVGTRSDLGSGSINAGATTYPPSIGGTGFGSNLTGYISNLRIIKGSGGYNATQTTISVPTAPLAVTANTSLLACQSATFVDNSSNNFTITANGNTVPRQFNPFGWTSTNTAYTPALYGGSAYFDGTGDYLNYTASLSLTGTFTLEGWFYNTSTSGQQQTICSFNSVSGNGYGSLRVDCDQGNTQFNFTVNLGTSGTAWASTISTNNAYVKNIWNHFAVCRDSDNTVRVFLNGVQIASATLSGTLYNTSTTHAIGCNNLPGAATNPFIGYISDLRLIVGTARYTSNFQPPVAPLTVLPNTTLLANMTGAGIYDSAAMTVYETAGNTGINTAFKKYGSTSMSFDGTGDYVSSTTLQPVGSGDFTIECWAYSTGSVNNIGIWHYASSLWPGGVTGLAVAFYGSSGWQFYYGGSNQQSGGTAPSANTWYHLAVVRSGTNLRLYVNGTSTISVTDSTNYTGQALAIGGYYNTGYLMTGYIDDFRITRGVARYTTTFTPPTSPYIRF